MEKDTTQLTNESGVQEQPKTDDYAIEALKKYKENSVSLDKYNELEKRYKTAVDNVINGQQPPKEEKKIERTCEQVYNDLNNGKSKSNYEYVKLQCEFREASLREGRIDPFIGVVVNEAKEIIEPPQEVKDKAQETYEKFKYLIDNCNNDPDVFQAEWNRRMK